MWAMLLAFTVVLACGEVTGAGKEEAEEQEDRWSAPMAETERVSHLEAAERMFSFGYDSYMEHAFPLDELNPHTCTGRSVDRGDDTNININDALGNFSLALIDSLDTLAVMGNRSEFARAVRLVIDRVSFDQVKTLLFWVERC
jgi:mannosidase alpha-like ER degradation enhancer 1